MATTTEMSIHSIIEDFEDIKGKAKVSDERFEQSLNFALLISEGRSKAEAYMTVFGEESKSKALNMANKLIRKKYVAQIVDRLITGNHILFADKHYQALNELFKIGMEGISERNRVDALKAFIDVTKRPETKVDTQINISIGSQMLESLEAQLNKMAAQAIMVSKNGDVIDAQVIH